MALYNILTAICIIQHEYYITIIIKHFKCGKWFNHQALGTSKAPYKWYHNHHVPH